MSGIAMAIGQVYEVGVGVVDDTPQKPELHLEDIDFDMVCPAFKSKLHTGMSVCLSVLIN